jgi:hypothetical protein
MRKINIELAILLVAIVSVLTYTVNSILKERKLKLPDPGYARVVEISSKVKLEYVCKGKPFEVLSSRTRTQVVGDTYRCFFDKKNCTDVRINYSEPVFLDSERRTISEGIVKDVQKIFQYIEFEYYVDEIKYQKIQIVEDFGTITEGDKYSIEYWNDNPERAIIYLKKR